MESSHVALAFYMGIDNLKNLNSCYTTLTQIRGRLLITLRIICHLWTLSPVGYAFSNTKYMDGYTSVHPTPPEQRRNVEWRCKPTKSTVDSVSGIAFECTDLYFPKMFVGNNAFKYRGPRARPPHFNGIANKISKNRQGYRKQVLFLSKILRKISSPLYLYDSRSSGSRSNCRIN